ncbi:MAG: hypothetical protein GF364_22715 [Candidatus Lokiarchaeota archaeon]|nr:hypothetical protein [Candidatus Lokiarchaeota archaeon]
MGDLHSRWHNGNLLYYDTYEHRLLDAIGLDITKVLLNPAYMPVDDTTGDLTGWTHTAVEAGASTSTAVLSDNTLLITTAGNEDDGVSLQVKGEAFDLASSNYTYFGIKLQTSEATECDLLVGLCITDTTLTGGMTDGVYFECLDGSTDINFVLEKDSTETTSASAVGTLADATDVTLEFVFDGTNVDCWVNGTLKTRLATTNLPDDEQLTPSIEYLNGSAAADTCTVKWMRAIQVNA